MYRLQPARFPLGKEWQVCYTLWRVFLEDAREVPWQRSLRNVEVATPKRHERHEPLLVGISYYDGTHPVWTPLEGPHVDVDHFQELVLYGRFVKSSSKRFFVCSSPL